MPAHDEPPSIRPCPSNLSKHIVRGGLGILPVFIAEPDHRQSFQSFDHSLCNGLEPWRDLFSPGLLGLIDRLVAQVNCAPSALPWITGPLRSSYLSGTPAGSASTGTRIECWQIPAASP